jgi:hypothetical protein
LGIGGDLFEIGRAALEVSPNETEGFYLGLFEYFLADLVVVLAKHGDINKIFSWRGTVDIVASGATHLPPDVRLAILVGGV